MKYKAGKLEIDDSIQKMSQEEFCASFEEISKEMMKPREMSAEEEALIKIVLATKEQYYDAQEELNAIERILCEYFESIGLKYWDVISGKGDLE